MRTAAVASILVLAGYAGWAGAQDVAERAAAMMRLEREINEQLATRAPASTRPFAAYEEAWRLKVEQVGAQSYPSEVRTARGSVRLTVIVRSDGSVQAVTLDRSSGHPVLDDAAMWIVRQAGPFAPFPPELAKQYDRLAITRTWFFE